LALPHRAVRCSHAAAKVDGHSERHLSDWLGESGARRQHVDTALKADVVVHVLKEIGLDVDDGAQLRGAVEARLRHIALADQERHLGEIGFEALGRHATGPFVNRKLAERLEPRPDLRLENLLERPGLRIDHDQGFGHLSPPMRLPPQPRGQVEGYHATARFGQGQSDGVNANKRQ
jgi:hypothetical protein